MTSMVLDTAMAMPTHLVQTDSRGAWIEQYLQAMYGIGHPESTERVLDGCDQLADLLFSGKRRDRTIDNVTTRQVAHTFGVASTERVPRWSIDQST